jgi:uncharacterized protein (TIGR03086 family)
MSDIQDRYRLIAGGFDARVRATAPDQWAAQSPCEDWKARDVVAHVVGGHRGVIAQVRGQEPTEMGADEDPEQAWADVYETMTGLAGDPDAMAKTIQGPIGPMPLEQILGRFVVMDVLVHTWDLARAVGGDERLDEESVRHAYEGLKPMDAMIRQPHVFGPKIEAPEGADLQTQFLYFLGRQA